MKFRFLFPSLFLLFVVPANLSAQQVSLSKTDIAEFARTCLSVYTGRFDPARMTKRGFSITRETGKKIIYARENVTGKRRFGATTLMVEKPGQKFLDCEVSGFPLGLTPDTALETLFSELKKAGYRRGVVRLRKNKTLDVWHNGPVKLRVYALGRGYGASAQVVSLKFSQSHLPLIK